MNLQDAVDHHRIAVLPHLPSVKLIGPLLNLNGLEAILDIVLLVSQSPLRLPSRNQEVVGQDAVKRRAISPTGCVEPFVGQLSDLLLGLIICVTHLRSITSSLRLATRFPVPASSLALVLCIRTSATASPRRSRSCRCCLWNRWRCCARRRTGRAGVRRRRSWSGFPSSRAAGCRPSGCGRRRRRDTSAAGLSRRRCPTPTRRPAISSR